MIKRLITFLQNFDRGVNIRLYSVNPFDKDWHCFGPFKFNVRGSIGVGFNLFIVGISGGTSEKKEYFMYD